MARKKIKKLSSKTKIIYKLSAYISMSCEITTKILEEYVQEQEGSYTTCTPGKIGVQIFYDRILDKVNILGFPNEGFYIITFDKSKLDSYKVKLSEKLNNIVIKRQKNLKNGLPKDFEYIRVPDLEIKDDTED